MKRISKLIGLFLFLLSNFAFGQSVLCPGDTLINTCDSSVVVYDTVSTTGFTTIDSISFLFTADAVDIDSGSGTGSGEMFYIDSTLVEITVWDTVGADTFSSCTFYVIITDTSTPSIFASDTTVYLDNSGGARIDTGYFQLQTWDNCSIDSVWLSRDTFSCADMDTTQVWIYITDAVGNKDSAVANVIILDTIPPGITCSDTAHVFLDSSGVAAFDTSYFGIVAWDNCSVDSVWLTQDTIYCPGDTLNQKWAYAMDSSGNIDSIEAVVYALDTIKPSAVCRDYTVYLDSLGHAILQPDSINNGSWDNCGIDSMLLSKSLFECGGPGLDSTTLYVFDNRGQVDSCMSYITVMDTISPVVVCKDTTVYLDASGEAVINAGFILSNGWDNCTIDSIYIRDTLFTCSDTGANQVLLIAFDPSGNVDSCTAIVTVRDTIPPKINCPYNIIVMSDPISCDTFLTIQAPVVSDNCLNTEITYTLSGASEGSGSGAVADTFFAGVTDILWAVTDGGGNLATCVQSVTTFTSFISVDDSVVTQEDTPVTFNPLDNDLDCDGDIEPSSIEIDESHLNHGSLDINLATGHITYTPDLNYFGNDTIRYRVSDDDHFIDSAIVYISITPVNDPPVLENETIVINEDSVATGNVLGAGDYDPEGGALTVSTAVLLYPSHGTFSVSADGNYTYNPVTNYNGLDTVVVTVCDSGTLQNSCANDTLFITIMPVNDLPVVQNDYLSIYEDNDVTSDVTTAGDYDPDGTPLTTSTVPVVMPSHGSFTIAEDGVFTYTPEPDYYGNEVIVVNVCDADLPVKSCRYDTVFISVLPVNDPPVVDNEYIATQEDVNFTGDLINGGDYDPDGTLLLAQNIVWYPSHGTLSIGANGEYLYKPAANFYGRDTAAVSICDNGTPGSECANDTIYITVSSVNDIPYVANMIANVSLDLYSSMIVPLQSVFNDADGDVLTYSASLAGGIPLPSWIKFDASTHSFLVLSPVSKYIVGEVIVVVTATDPYGASVSDEFNITVNQTYSISGYVVTREGPVTDGSTPGTPAGDVPMIIKEGTVPVDTVLTDSKGNYRFEGLDAKTYEVLVNLQYYSQDTTVLVTLTPTNPERDSVNFTIWVNHGKITDVNDLSERVFDVKMYPNPTTGEVNLIVNDGNSGDIEVSVYTPTGEKIFERVYMRGGRISFDMSQHISGMYFVKLRAGNYATVKKLILNR
ncbi:hypothetical protein MNBD_BACTEROID01-742 [hydrothermal vent metagenome]|uniref:HYR domain-containing protein n=1 Tax=hydrothermal vent metagenome TaxID=652676 RepID=A0A3B0UPL1_9ZZZZ